MDPNQPPSILQAGTQLHRYQNLRLVLLSYTVFSLCLTYYVTYNRWRGELLPAAEPAGGGQRGGAGAPRHGPGLVPPPAPASRHQQDSHQLSEQVLSPLFSNLEICPTHSKLTRAMG
jgi:hypothetical protein